MKWTEHVACIVEMRNSCKTLVPEDVKETAHLGNI
jgi:hypothetical protein